MRKFIALILLMSSLIISAQKKRVLLRLPKRLLPMIKKTLFIIAGKEMEGRETATEGQRKAAIYIESQFRSLGLLPVIKDSYQLNYLFTRIHY
jgi:hypothetical protein